MSLSAGRRFLDALPEWRRLMLALAVVVALVLAVLTFAVRDAKARILQALGPRATVGQISLSYPLVTLRDVRVAADPSPGAWPSREEFHAALVEVRIDVASLWARRHGAPLRLDDVRVEDGVLVMRRTRDRLVTLPALRETTQAAASQAASAAASTPATPTPDDATTLVIGRARFARMAIDLYDDTLPDKTRHHLRFEQVQGTVDGLALPGLAQRITLDLRGVLKGLEHDGTVSIAGSLTPAAHGADLALRLAHVDMIALQPYLLRFGEQSVRHGSLDMTLDAHVVDHVVHAPGQLTLTGLQFGEGPGTFAGIEKRAVLAALARDGRIDLRFTLDGRTDDPKFTLDEKLGIRIAAVLGETVGLSVKGVVEGVGGVFRNLLGTNKP